MFVMEIILFIKWKQEKLKTHCKTFQRTKIRRSAKVIGAFQHTSKYYKKNSYLKTNLTRKFKKTPKWTKNYPDYPLYRRKGKMKYVVGKIHGKIYNQGMQCTTNS